MGCLVPAVHDEARSPGEDYGCGIIQSRMRELSIFQWRGCKNSERGHSRVEGLDLVVYNLP